MQKIFFYAENSFMQKIFFYVENSFYAEKFLYEEKFMNLLQDNTHSWLVFHSHVMLVPTII